MNKLNYFNAILFYSDANLLQHQNLNDFCRFAQKLRNRVALLSVLSFLSLFLLVIFSHAIALIIVFYAACFFFSAFVCFAILASRFGRLCRADVNMEYRSNITHLCELEPACKAYYEQVQRAGRPFTRVDLNKLSKIYLARR